LSTDDRIKIVCEDGGRHSVRTLEYFDRDDQGQWYAWVHDAVGDAALSRPRARGGVLRTADGWQFECSECKVNARVPHQVLTMALDRLEAHGLKRIGLDMLNLLACNKSRA
jgi:hypothetical protein